MVTAEAAQAPSAEVERYSFSKLSSWWTCPYGYYQRYIEHKPGIGNAFSSFGTLVHEIMEDYANGKIDLWDLAKIYEWRFDAAVKEKFPYNKYVNLRDKYYNDGLRFLKTFSGYDNVKIMGVEENFTIPIDDWYFVGVIDLMFVDKDGRWVIRDYKSKASFKDENEKYKYARQLYLYSLHVHELTGRYPDELQFLMFRKSNEPVRIQFNEADLHEAVDWAKDTVRIIRNAFDYPAQCDEFYSQNLCNHREYCTLKLKKKYGPRKNKK